MIKISNPRGWKGIQTVLDQLGSELRSSFKQSAIVWPLPSSSIAMLRMTIVKRKGLANDGCLLEITAGFKEVQIEIKKLKQYDLNSRFAGQTIKVVQQTITKLLSNHH